MNAFSFYWLQQPQAGGPLLGPHLKSSAKVSKIRSSQNWKIQSSFFLSYKTTTKVWDFGMGDGDFAASWSFSSISVSEIMLYRDCASQLPYLERNKCGNGAAEVPLLESRTDLSWCFWRKLSEIEAGRVETVYPVGNQLHARWTSSLQSVSPGMLLFMGSRLESFTNYLDIYLRSFWVSVLRCRRCRFDPWVGKIAWRRAWQPTPVFLPGKSHRQKSLAGYSPWDCGVHAVAKSQTWLSN